MEDYLGNRIEGSMSHVELRWLYHHALSMDSIVEVGSFYGRSSHALLSACKGTVYCIDHFEGSPFDETRLVSRIKNIREGFLRNVGNFENLVLMTMESIEASKHFSDKSIDMIFIDGGHDYASVKADLEVWVPKCKKLICGHDFNNMDVARAVSEKFSRPRNEVDTIWEYRL
jgi:predicted O-methyltransferase YrrM